MKKLSLVLALLMVFAMISACTPADTGSSAPNTSAQSAASTAPAASTAAAAPEVSEEAPRIVFYQNTTRGATAGSEAGSNPDDLKMVQDYILEQTGVYLDAILSPVEGAKEKLSMILAGGEQLDVWFDNWMTYSPSGTIMPINSLLDNSPIVRSMWESWEAWPAMTAPDGTIWGVPRMTPTTPYPVFVREDWLEALNLQQPTTFDELEAYLYAVKEADFYGNGQTIPLITRGTNLNHLESCLAGNWITTGSTTWLDPTDNTVKPLQLAPGYKEFLTKMNQWYKDGILHMENMAWDTSTVRDYIGKGAVGATATWYSDVSLFAESLRTNVPGASFNLNESGINGQSGTKIGTIAKSGTTGMLIHSKCQNPEAVFTLLEWMYSDFENYNTAYMGIKDVHWKYLDTPGAEENRLTTVITKSDGGVSGYFADCALAIGLPFETLSLQTDADGTVNMHSFWLREHLDDFDAFIQSFEQNIFYNSQDLEENVITKGDLDRIKAEELIKFLTGERPISDYDAFIEQWYAAGLQDLINEYTRQYNELSQ